MITVIGATGNTGSKIVYALLKAGHKVRALGRSESKLLPLKKAGAEVLTGDAVDTVYLTKAFSGVDAVYTLLPPDPRSPAFRTEQDRLGEAIVRAIRESGVKYVVALSSIGAEVPEGTGPIAGLHAQEERLKGIEGTNVLLLRAGFFFENFYMALPLIKQKGIYTGSYALDLALPMIGTHDIAVAATKSLIARDWKGVVVRELLGQRDLTFPEATRILGEHIGKAGLKYVPCSYDEQSSALVGMGLSASFASLYVEMVRAMNEKKIRLLHGRTTENTTPTRFEDFVGQLTHAYKAA